MISEMYSMHVKPRIVQKPEKKDTEDLQKKNIEELFSILNSSSEGLGSQEAERRFHEFGPNSIEEKKVNPIIKFLGYFWGPIPWMIEAAAILSFIVRHWVDLIIIVVLLTINAVVGFWQEHQAANAVEALKKQLALRALAKRDGSWRDIDSKFLVPGDVIRLRLGDIIPADAKLISGDYLSVDQSALTGESLPVDKSKGDAVYSGSIARQGSMAALVITTGARTFFGRTTRLVSEAQTASHFQKAVLQIGDYLIYLSLILVAILVTAMLFRGEPLLTLVQFSLILIVASIPVAMPAVLSMTMAIGAMLLARKKAIVTRLESIEEMAGMDVLCCDKTGTLTQNRLTLGEPALFGAMDKNEIILAGVLASESDNPDAIDEAVINGLPDKEVIRKYKIESFTPFDPVHKRTEALISDQGGNLFKVAKGAPQVILGLCNPAPDQADRARSKIEEFASDGFRTLGVARRDKGGVWVFLGLLPLFDPPREDSAETIREAREYGIQVKMVTGDNLAIARQISARLGLGTDIHVADEFFKKTQEQRAASLAPRVEAAEGFAQVFPEHKFEIVRSLQSLGHITGMTGDGVNDAPALKQANMGIAVSGATDAARAAADLVLTLPGLSVIVNAVEEARRIFERMNSYSIYRITETIRIMLFVVLAMLVFNLYPITTIMIILLALLNDLPIMTIAYDRTDLETRPVKWQMHRVLTISTILGIVGLIQTFGILLIAKLVLGLDQAHVQSFIYLKLAVAGHMTLFVVRTRKPFYSKPYPAPILLIAILSTQTVAACIVGFGLLVTRLPWTYVGWIWVYCIVWFFINDQVKLAVYRHLGMSGTRHLRFLHLLQEQLHPQLDRADTSVPKGKK